MTDESRASLFEPGDLIHQHTDQDAIDDGFIIALNKHDRMTTAVFGFLSESVATIDGPPPQRWPIALTDWCNDDPDRKALALAKGFVGAHRREALASEPAADFYTAYFLKDESGRLIGYCDKSLGDNATQVWLVPNSETGGVTLMFPADY